jgi:hypothetical protein
MALALLPINDIAFNISKPMVLQQITILKTLIITWYTHGLDTEEAQECFQFIFGQFSIYQAMKNQTARMVLKDFVIILQFKSQIQLNHL